MTQKELQNFPEMPSKKMAAQSRLIALLESQIVDLTMMSKIELGDDVIAEIQQLKAIAIDEEFRIHYPANVEGSVEFNKSIAETSLNLAIEAVAEARLIMESYDPTPAMTIGYDEESYTLTPKEMTAIAGALYLADCQLYDMQR